MKSLRTYNEVCQKICSLTARLRTAKAGIWLDPTEGKHAKAYPVQPALATSRDPQDQVASPSAVAATAPTRHGHTPEVGAYRGCTS